MIEILPVLPMETSLPGDGTLGVRADNFNSQSPAVTVCVLIATGDLAVLIGLATAGGNGDLAAASVLPEE